MTFIVLEPDYTVLIDKKDVTTDVIDGSIEHQANAIDSFSMNLRNEGNKYENYFTNTLRRIEIWLGDIEQKEKVFSGFVEQPVPTIADSAEIYEISGLSTAACLNFQEVPESYGTYTEQTIAYIVNDLMVNYVELLLRNKILSGSGTHNYDPTNKRPLSIFQELALIEQCYFITDPFNRFTFDLNKNMIKLDIKLDECLCDSIREVYDLTQIINYFTFKGDPDAGPAIKVTSEDTISQEEPPIGYYKRTYSDEDKNFSDSTLAQAYADEVIEKYKDPLVRYEIELIAVLDLKVNHKILLDSKTYNILDHYKIDSISRTFSEGDYNISLTLENSPPTIASIFSKYQAQFEKLIKDVQL